MLAQSVNEPSTLLLYIARGIFFSQWQLFYTATGHLGALDFAGCCDTPVVPCVGEVDRGSWLEKKNRCVGVDGEAVDLSY